MFAIEIVHILTLPLAWSLSSGKSVRSKTNREAGGSCLEFYSQKTSRILTCQKYFPCQRLKLQSKVSPCIRLKEKVLIVVSTLRLAAGAALRRTPFVEKLRIAEDN